MHLSMFSPFFFPVFWLVAALVVALGAFVLGKRPLAGAMVWVAVIGCGVTLVAGVLAAMYPLFFYQNVG